jgi:integrase
LKPAKKPVKTRAEERINKTVDKPEETAKPPQPMLQSKYRHLLDDPDVMRWFKNECRGSEIGGREHLRRLGAICGRFDKTPAQLGKMTTQQAKDFILDMVSEMEAAGMRANYIRNFVKSLRSWLRHKNIDFTLRVKISKQNRTAKYQKERPPTPDELKKALDVTDIRRRAAIALVAFAGVRLQVLGDYLGRDGLKVEDFPEMTIENGRVEFKRVPTKLVVRATLSKTGNEYVSFLNEEGCEYLQAYLEERMHAKMRKKWSHGKWSPYEVPAEQLTPGSPIMTPDKFGLAGKHIRTTNIGDLIRVAIRKAGYDWRPYNLRRYFDVRMMRAEGDKLIIRDYRVFWMGHSGDIEAVYTLNKDLDDETWNELRNAYARADEACLTTKRRRDFSEERAVAIFNRLQLKYAGYSDEELAKLGDLAAMAPEQVQELVDKKNANSHASGNSARQKVVPASALPEVLGGGAEFVSNLPDGQVVVRLPTA